jgi:hypothetical protein
MNLEEEAQKLREELRRGRINTAGQDPLGNATDSAFENGPGHKALLGTLGKVPGSDRQDADSQRGTDQIIERGRRPDRRSGAHQRGESPDSAIPASAAGTRAIAGRIERLDDIPERAEQAEEPEPPFGRPIGHYKDDYRQVGSRYVRRDNPAESISNHAWRKLEWAPKSRPVANPAAGKPAPTADYPTPAAGASAKLDKGDKQSIFPWFKQGQRLSQAEARELEEPLKAALLDDCQYADQYIWWRCQDATQSPIWSDIADEEVAVLARLLLKRGQRDAATATMVRAVVNGSDYITALMILIPRTIKTIDAMKRAPKRERPKFAKRRPEAVAP